MQEFLQRITYYFQTCYGNDPFARGFVGKSLVLPTNLTSDLQNFCVFFNFINVIVIGIFILYFLIHFLLFLIGQNKQPFNPLRIVFSLLTTLLSVDIVFVGLFYFFISGRPPLK